MDRIRDKVQCNPTVKLTKGEMYPFVGIDRITSGNRDIAIADKEVYSGQSCSKFRKGDTIMARITPCLENGKIAQYNLDSEIAMGSTELFVFREIENISDKDYIYYLISTDYVRNNAVNSMTGASGRQRADIKFIGKLKWNFPEYDVQCKIGKILSTYDDLIEKNNRKIEILQDMAEELYKEWFVRFRFPGYKTVERKESALGSIPSSFDVLKMTDVFDNYIGGGWGNDDENTQYCVPAFVIRGTDFPSVTKGDISTCPYRWHKESNYKSRQLKPNDIVIEISGGTAEQPVGRVILIDDDLIKRFGNKVICASFCKQVSLKQDRISPVYFYYWMKFLYDTRMIDRFQLQSTGIINFKFEYFVRKGDVLLPPRTLMDKFDNIVTKMRKNISRLAEQNDLLKQQRDLLLPRLMSGKLAVKVS